MSSIGKQEWCGGHVRRKQHHNSSKRKTVRRNQNECGVVLNTLTSRSHPMTSYDSLPFFSYPQSDLSWSLVTKIYKYTNKPNRNLIFLMKYRQVFVFTSFSDYDPMLFYLYHLLCIWSLYIWRWWWWRQTID